MQKSLEYSQTQLREKIDSIIRGWLNYFKLNETDKQKLMIELEQKYADQPDSMPKCILKSALAYQLGDHGGALKILQTETVLSSEDADINFQWGVLCDLLGMKNEALDSYIAAFRIDQEHPEAAYRLGLAYLHQQQNEKAIRYLQKAVKTSPQNAAVHFALATALQNYSLNGAARKAFQKAFQLEPKLKKLASGVTTHAEPSKTSVTFDFSEPDIQQLLRLFSGREGVFSRQWLNDDGKMGYMPVYQAMTTKDIKAHLRGEQTLGFYLMRSDNTVNQMVFDIDITKQVRSEVLSDKEQIADWKNLLWTDVSRILQIMNGLDIKAYAEDSGFKGIHIWVFFTEPQMAREVVLLAKKILAMAAAPPPGLHREVFPKEAYVSAKALGSMIKLPLGIHKLTNRRCLFLDINGNPVSDQFLLLQNIETVSSNRFRLALEQLKTPAMPDTAEQDQASKELIDKVFTGCNIVRYLREKAEKDKMLTHTDRLTLLGVLGHLDKAGQQTLHTVIGHTLNYSYRITEKWIKRQKGFPLSCPKIRQWQSDITPAVGCYCKFPERKNSYPSPVLHADLDMIVKIKSKASSAAAKDADRSAVVQNHKAQTKPVTESPPEATTIDEEITLEAKTSNLPIVKMDELINNYLKFKKDQRQIQQKINEMEKQLDAYCEQQKSEQFETSMGLLKRIKIGEGYKWVIEI